MHLLIEYAGMGVKPWYILASFIGIAAATVFNFVGSPYVAFASRRGEEGFTLKLDIVIPIYNEEENLGELQRRLRDVCSRIEGCDWQVFYVNDGSADRSLSMMLEQHRSDPRFTVLDLSRNFGHQAAITAGLMHGWDAEVVVFMDGDLQDPPEVIPDLIECLERRSSSCPCPASEPQGKRPQRRLGFEAFHKVFTWVSDFPHPIHKPVSLGWSASRPWSKLKKLTEKNRFFPGLRSWVGFEQGIVYYDRQERAGGEPKQSFKRLIKYALGCDFQLFLQAAQAHDPSLERS